MGVDDSEALIVDVTYLQKVWYTIFYTVPNTHPKSPPSEGMTCVAHNSIFEIIDERDHMAVHSVFVQDVKLGDLIRDPLTFSYTRIVAIQRQETGENWPLFSYMGLNADAAQWVYDLSKGWTPISNVGVPSVTPCPSIYSVTLENGRAARVSGATCCTNDPNYDSLHSIPSPLASSLSSSLSDESW